MISLRPYQQTGVEEIREAFRSGLRKVLYVSPTGSGKTTLFSYLSAGVMAAKKRVAILAHREELLDQISGRLSDFNVDHAVLRGGTFGTPRNPVVVASVFTLARRLDHFPPPDLIVVDESHHAVGRTTWGKVINKFPASFVLGVTATPVRLSGEGLGEVFQTMIVGPTVAELTAQGYLTPAVVYGPPHAVDLSGLRTRGGDFEQEGLAAAMDRPQITGDAVSHYRKLADGKAAIGFCCSVQHAKDVAADFTRQGYRAAAVDGTTDRDIRRRAVRDLVEGRLQVLTSCDIFSEGFDAPRVEVGIMLRPTQSMGLWLQQVGRCLRPWAGKTEALILDHAGNAMRHGLPDTPREWTLEGEKRGRKSAPVQALRTCPKCLAIYPPAPVCPRCGWAHVVEARKPEEVEGELVRLDAAAVQRTVSEKMRRIGKARTREELERLAVELGYRPRWVDHILEARARRRAA